jgi:DNA ligase 1
MANEFMMLAKDFDPDKATFPAQISEKLDGVASYFVTNPEGTVSAWSRQGKPITSVPHIEDWLSGRLPTGCRVCGELTVSGREFKDASGLIRRNEPCAEIVLNVYDYLDWELRLSNRHTYAQRMQMMVQALGLKDWVSYPVRLIPGGTASDMIEGNAIIQSIYNENPKAEGVMVRAWHGEHSLYKFGRSWGMMRIKPKPTIDLPIVGFEEAVSKDDKPLGMVGKVIARYKKQNIGVGPGRLSHEDRKTIWANQNAYVGLIAEIQYMKDDSYTALRQPTFQQWRLDKSNSQKSSLQ